MQIDETKLKQFAQRYCNDVAPDLALVRAMAEVFGLKLNVKVEDSRPTPEEMIRRGSGGYMDR
jgi:hypothetical protein